MLLKGIIISKSTKKKILYKHHIKGDELYRLFNENPLYLRIGDCVYLAIGVWQRYITIIFSYNKGIARIITAYPSSKQQIRLFKKKRNRI